MKNQSKFRTLTLIGVFVLLATILSSCVYTGRPVRYYDRPPYAHRHYVRVQPRVVVVPKHNRHGHHHDRHYRNNNGRHRGHR